MGLEPFGCRSAGHLLPSSESLAENTTASESCLRLTERGALWHAFRTRRLCRLSHHAFGPSILGAEDDVVQPGCLGIHPGLVETLGRRLHELSDSGHAFGAHSLEQLLAGGLLGFGAGIAWSRLEERLAAVLQSMQSFADSCYVCISLLYGMDPAHRD